MAAKNRPTVANYITNENYSVGKPHDFDDHTFSGMMFNLKCRTLLPVSCLVIRSVAVRGRLGEMRVFVTKGGYRGKKEDAKQWQLVYHGTHEQSFEKVVDMTFDNPVMIVPGDVLGIYVHCSDPGDEGVVYDRRRRGTNQNTFSDNFIHITSGTADLNSKPFQNVNPWTGSPTGGWRENREFVGNIE